jgi:hypothetical protein
MQIFSTVIQVISRCAHDIDATGIKQLSVHLVYCTVALAYALHEQARLLCYL